MPFFNELKDSTWHPSIGEKFWKLHRRSGHWHEETDPSTGETAVHYDEYDPHESPKSLFFHLITNKWVQLGALALATDLGLNNGRGTKKLIRTAKKFLS